jgi:serine/threonine protein kinase
VHEAHLDLRQLSFVAPLGKGSTASVFEVEHSSSELNDSSRHLALKVMKLGKHNDKHWLRERTVLELLKNEPSVVKLVAAFEMAYIPLPPEGVFFDAKTPVRALALEHCPRGELVSDGIMSYSYNVQHLQ